MPPFDINSRLQAMVDRYVDKRQVRSIVAGIQSTDGRIDAAAAAGHCDVGGSVEMTADTPYHLASITKMYTATVVMMLAGSGEIDLNAPISEYLGADLVEGIHVIDETDHSGSITVSQLLDQTSGLADYFDGKSRGGSSLADDLKEGRDRALRIGDICEIVRHLPPEFAPGAGDGRKAHYSDTNYALLGAIIEAVTGVTVADTFRETLFMPVPGLKLVCPATAYDAVGLLRTAVRCDDPVMIFEHKKLYGSKGARAESGAIDASSDIPDDDYTVPFGKAAIRREGRDVTVIATLLMMHRSLIAAELLAGEGISAEVIDPRSLVPFDWDTVRSSIEKTGRVVIAEESPKRSGIGAELAATVAEDLMDSLIAPIKRVAAPNTPAPFAPAMEGFYVPDAERIAAAVREVCAD